MEPALFFVRFVRGISAPRRAAGAGAGKSARQVGIACLGPGAIIGATVARSRRKTASAATRRGDVREVQRLLLAAEQSFARGHLGQARKACQRLLKLQRDHPRALHLLGLVAEARGDLAAAQARIADAVRLQPQDPELHFDLGRIQMSAGRPADAVASYRRTVELAPGVADAHYALANALFDDGAIDEAVASYRQALVIKPGDIDAALNLGNALAQQGDLSAAVEAYRAALRQAPNHAAVLVNLARTLSDLDQYEAAVDYYRQAIAAEPDLAPAHTGLGFCLQAFGRFEEAERHLLRALELDPADTAAVNNLVTGKRAQSFETVRAIVEHVERRLESSDLTPDDRTTLCFALGKVFDDLERYPDAFRMYAEGNALRAGASPFDMAAHARMVDETISLLTPDFFVRNRDVGLGSDLPVFVVGMPRSGTTMVEQIIARHADAVGAGELAAIPDIVRALMRAADAPSPACLTTHIAEPGRALVSSHLQWLEGRADGASRVVDKAPLNFIHLGLISCLLPKAAIVHCVRDPLDTCLSCFFQHFTSGHLYSYDLATLGRYYRQYRRLMDHWRSVLPVPILDVSYEELVADPEPLVRRILDHCGLPWDPHCLEPNKAQTAVTSASTWQVRQPIYRSSVGRWRHYEGFLGPLIEALGGEDGAPDRTDRARA